MPGRSYNLNNYRYNYQGQELADNMNWQNFELRMHNTDLGRWMSPDPYGQFFSPYVSMGNNPVSGIDPDGGQAIDNRSHAQKQKENSSNGHYINYFGASQFYMNYRFGVDGGEGDPEGTGGPAFVDASGMTWSNDALMGKFFYKDANGNEHINYDNRYMADNFKRGGRGCKGG